DRRQEVSAVPHLWYLAGAPKLVPAVRDQARAMLAKFLNVEADRLPSPKAALTREAERYFQHRERFLNPDAVTLWLWDGKELTSRVVPASKAEEYFGLRYARQALEIDPAYLPAQVLFLSTAVDKGYERAGFAQPLSKAAPEVNQLLATMDPVIVYGVLERGLKDHRVPVILGALQALGEHRATGVGLENSAILQALYYPDRRVQYAAAD